MDDERLNLDPIRSRLINAGYPHLRPGESSRRIRETSREAKEARAELRAHIIADIWALLDEVVSLRAGDEPGLDLGSSDFT